MFHTVFTLWCWTSLRHLTLEEFTECDITASQFSQILKCSQNFSADTAEIICIMGFYQNHWNCFKEMNLFFSFKFTFPYFYISDCYDVWYL